jgi:TolB protein
VKVCAPSAGIRVCRAGVGWFLLTALAVILVGVLAGGARSAGEATGLIAFTRPDGIYVMRTDGTGVRLLRGGPAASQALQLDWSADGSRIAFESRGAIWVMGAHGEGLTRVVPRGGAWGSAHSPTWSPDGHRLAFSAERAREIWVADADGSNAHRLLRLTMLEAEDIGVGEIDWSPNGRRIAFTGHGGWLAWVYVVNTNGTNLRRLTERGWAWATNPRWSPDGRRIAFEQWARNPTNNYSDRDSEIYAMTLDGGPQIRLTTNREYDGSPVWSPDGRRIAFVRFGHGCAECPAAVRGRNEEIFVVNADGTGLRRLTHNRVGEASPAWQPIPAS